MDLRIIQIKLCLKDQFWPAGFLLHLESDQSRSWTFQGLFTKRGGICKLSEAIPFSGGSRGEARGASLPPVIFRPNWGPKGRKKFEAAPPPLSQGLDGLDDCPPPPSLPPPILWRSISATGLSLAWKNTAEPPYNERLFLPQWSIIYTKVPRYNETSL